MSNNDRYQITDLAKDNLNWRVDWFGAVTYTERFRRTSQPLIEIQLSCLSEILPDLNQLFQFKNNEWPKTKQIKLPVGLLPLFKIGDIWREGYCVDSPNYDVVQFRELDVGRNNSTLIKAGLPSDESGDYYLPLSHHPYHLRHTQSYCLLVEHTDCRLVIPSIELIRFYFGSSSSLVSRLFDAPFTQESLWVGTDDTGNRRFPRIHLAPGISGRSASDIGRIAYSRTARAAAELIGHSCIAASANKEPVYPKAVFPFEDTTDLRVSGKWLPFGGNERGVFLVFKILSCTHPFPFDTLRYTSTKKNTSTSINQVPQSQDKGQSDLQRIATRARRETKSIVDEEPDKAKLPRKLGLKFGISQFPDLDNKQVTKIENEVVPTILIRKSGVSIIDASSVGESGKDPGIQPIELSRDTDFSAPPKASGNVEHPFAVNVFFELLSAIQTLNPSVTVSSIRLDTRQRYDFLSIMPSIVDEDGEICPACLVPVKSKDGTHSTGSRNRKISIACIVGVYSACYIMIPESKESGDEEVKIELHVLKDARRSIKSTQDLIAAMGVHFSMFSGEFNCELVLGPSTTSIAFQSSIKEAKLAAQELNDFAKSHIKLTDNINESGC